MVFKWVLLSVALILLGLSSSALTLSHVPSSITFWEQTKEIKFEALNDSGFEQELGIEFFGPIRYRIANSVPSTLLPGERTQIVLQLFPQDASLNTEYKSTLYATLGEETVKKEIMLFFEQDPGKQLNQNPETQNENPTGFASLGEVPEFWTNFVLLIIIAIVLIAFIARANQK